MISLTSSKYVTIKVKIDQDKADSRVNLEDKKFLEITHLTYNGAKVTKVRRTQDLDLFKPEGLTGSEHTLFERIGYFERVLSGIARDRFGKIYTKKIAFSL